jgi:type IV secretory pathway TraG/TraD family ATPase VirD4
VIVGFCGGEMVVRRLEDVALVVIGGLAGLAAALWCGGAFSALFCGHAVPTGRPLAGFLALHELGDPSQAWEAAVGPAVVYWPITALVLAIAGGLGIVLYRVFTSLEAGAPGGGSRSTGLASRSQVRHAAGVKTLLRRGRLLRAGLATPRPHQVGYRLGRGAGVDCWATVEDSLLVLGPPRSGKGLHLVIPAILDAPGAVVTTSTRPDSLAATIKMREQVGPVAVFDPQGLTVGMAWRTRWSPTRGCELPRTAIARAAALCAQPVAGVDNASFWTQQSLMATRCLLHAAALDHREPVELYNWSLSPLMAQDAADILRLSPNAAPGWGSALESILGADPRQRDSVWAMVGNVFAALADPSVLDAVSPVPGEEFDPDRFLADDGTVYLLGTAAGASATANLVAAFVEDIVESARRSAASSPGARLDPPLTVVLDEAANYPLAALPSLMSDGGGAGITPMVVLQSLAQARARWGEQDAAAIFDAAIVKIILGGSGSADDLRNLSALIGIRKEERVNQSWGRRGERTSSTVTHDVPILDPGRLRTLPFGQAVLLLRSAPPILLTLQPWTCRRDARLIRAQRTEVEDALRRGGVTAA